jgi:tyrosinase
MGDLRKKLTRRRALKLAAAGAALAMPAVFRGSPAFAATPLRKNIDKLSADELDTYKHAIKIVMDRGTANPSAMDGYAWQAVLHNDFDRIRGDGETGGCEHRNELFFPWHRAHLAGFEKILRATDPQRTANVTIPYWDWTLPPSGVRFPKAFEDATSPLFVSNGRYHKPADVPGGFGLLPVIQWDPQEVKTKMVQENDWFLFAGNARQPDGPGGSFGWVEKGPHNTIHPSIGTTMGNTSTASRDPIYWSFHACIDLIWARWQKVHTDATHAQPFATPQTKIWVEPFVPVVQEMAQTDTLPAGFAYGYDYDFSIDAAPLMVADSTVTRRTMLEAEAKDPQFSATKPVRIDSTRRKLLRVENVAVYRDTTYALRAYVHPPSVDLASASEADKARYLADSATIWASGGHSHHPADLYLDLTKAIQSVGGDFVVSLVTQPMSPDAARPGIALAPQPATARWKTLSIEER